MKLAAKELKPVWPTLPQVGRKGGRKERKEQEGRPRLAQLEYEAEGKHYESKIQLAQSPAHLPKPIISDVRVLLGLVKRLPHEATDVEMLQHPLTDVLSALAAPKTTMNVCRPRSITI